MSVFLDDCSGDVDCVYFFDGVTCANLWKGNVLPTGGVPTKSLIYMFVNESSVPNIPLESVFALTPLITDGRFHIIKTSHMHSTPILLGFYVGILHCHSSPEIRFSIISKDPALDIVVDQLSSQGRTVRRISTDSFSDIFPHIPSSSSSSSSSSTTTSSFPPRPSSSTGFIPGIISPSIQNNSVVVPQLILPPNLPASPSHKSLPFPTVNNAVNNTPNNTVNNATQSDAEIINEIVNTEKFNKKTKKRIVNKLNNKRDVQISLINKFLETNNMEKASFICNQFNLHSLFPFLDKNNTLIPQPSAIPVNPPATLSSPLIHPMPSQQAITVSHPNNSIARPQRSLSPTLPNSDSSSNIFQQDELDVPSQTPTVQELQQMQLLRRQASQGPQAPIAGASPKKKAQPNKASKPAPTTPRKSAEASPNIQPEKEKGKPNDNTNNKSKTTKSTPVSSAPLNANPTSNGKYPSTPSTNNATPTPMNGIHNHTIVPETPNTAHSNSTPSSLSSSSSSSTSSFLSPPPASKIRNGAAIKAIASRLLSRVYPNHHDIRMDWDDPLELALQCLAHLNVTEKHDDQESRFLVRLLLATMLESGVKVSTGPQDYSPFSLQENAVVIQETLKLLVHWGYTPDVIQTFREIYMNDTGFFMNNSILETHPVEIFEKDASDYVDQDTNSEDEHTWVEGWNARRMISNASEVPPGQ